MEPSHRTTITPLSGWVLDLFITGVLVLAAVALERMTAGRLESATIAITVGIGCFVLLRLGALLARVGRTFGCGFAFFITWLLPCGLVGWLVASTERQMMVRDSLPLFVLLGAYLIVVMGITFERVRLHDTQKLADNGQIPSADA